MPTQPPRKVTTIAFDQRADEELTRLQEELGAASKAEVLRHALSLYGFLQRELSEGGDLLIERPDTDVITRIVVPGFHPPRPRRASASAAAADVTAAPKK
jgi:hypothetical protein